MCRKLLFLIFLLNTALFAQTAKIIKVIDANLFQLSDSSFIKLAGIDMPRIDNPDYFLRKTALDALEYARNRILYKKFRIDVILQNEYKLVYLIEDLPFGDKNYNLYFLEEGFGKFINNMDSNDYKIFSAKEKLAKEKRKGIWKIHNIEIFDTLDRDFAGSERQDPALTDSLEYLILTTPKPDAGHFISEIILAPVGGIISSIPAALVTGGLYAAIFGQISSTPYDALFVGGVGAILGYLAGNALTVYYISEKTTKKANYWNLVLYSIAGAAVGTGIAALNNDHTRQGVVHGGFYAPIFFSSIGAAVYATWIAPDRFPAGTNSKIEYSNLKPSTADHFYNRSKIVEVNLFRIQF